MKSVLKEKYNKVIAKEFIEKFGVKNIMAVPKITKVVINTGIGKYVKEKDAVDEIFDNLKVISGQKPVLTKAKQSISGFKTRQGQAVGVTVTLRGERMWHFLERLVYSAFPRVRDFRGIDRKNFDKQGNLNIPLKEQIVFPEIVPENVKNIFSFQITVVNTASSREEGIEFMKMMGFPLATQE
jgi:large subunit ribosomal protein L5